jgi:uncharacterized membrane protein YhhN
MTESKLKLWLALYIIFSGAYMALEGLGSFSFGWVIKTIPLFLLMLFCQVSLTGKIRTFMLLGLFFSVSGDILLSLDGFFIPGLGVFLIAQIIYTGVFLSEFKLSKKGVYWMLLILTYTITLALFILPHVGDFILPVSAYMIAISLMAISAGFRNAPHFLFIALGALIFMSSDTLIAISKFVSPFYGSGFAIMLTYYAAQLIICLGIVRHYNLSHTKS